MELVINMIIFIEIKKLNFDKLDPFEHQISKQKYDYSFSFN